MRWSPSLVLLAVAAVVGGLVVADLRSPSTVTDRPDPVAAGPAEGGAWYCAAGAVGETDELSVVSAAPVGGSAPSDTEVRVVADGTEVIASDPVFPGSARVSRIEGLEAAELGTTVRWWDQPTAVGRVWQVRGEGPSGIVSGPCAASPSPTWYVPGMSTAGGSSAQVHLANPFAADASVEIQFLTPAGPEAPILLENVSVPAESVEVVDLAEHIPRQADVGVVVRTRAGRVVVEGVQRLDPAIGGVDAVSLVRAAPRLSETWTIPWSLTDPSAGVPEDVAEGPTEDPADAPTEDVTEEPTEVATEEPTEESTEETTDVPTEASTEVDPADLEQDVPTGEVVQTASPGGGTASWLWVANPGVEPAAVTVTLHTVDGPVVPDIGDELTVEGGQVLRVDLRGLLPAGQSVAGATVRSENGVPVAAGASSLVGPELGDADQTGYVSQLGWPAGDPSWVVPGEATGGRRQVLHVVNPGADAALVDVAVWDGAALQRPADLQGLQVAPGALVEMDVTEVVGDTDHTTAFVTASQGMVVAGRHSVGGDVADWVAHTGVPSRLWSGGDVVPPVDHDPELIERLGTTGGLPVGTETPGGVPSDPAPSRQPTTESPADPDAEAPRS